MENDKHYHPNLEDLRVGYEFEYSLQSIHLPNGMDWKKMVVEEKHLFPDYSDQDNEAFISFIAGAIKRKNIRVPYLTKEQIESEGWKITKNLDDEELTGQKIKSDFTFFEIYYDTFLKELIVEEFNQAQLVNAKTGDYNSNTIFKGECKSINEFRIIIKMLKWINIENPEMK